jgi:hypothetical protein
MLMGYNIYNDFIGNLNVVAPLYGTAQDLQVVFQALTLISVCSCSQTVILEHFNCTLILKWKLSHLVLVSF